MRVSAVHIHMPPHFQNLTTSVLILSGAKKWGYSVRAILRLLQVPASSPSHDALRVFRKDKGD